MKNITEGHTGEDYDGDGVPGGKISTVFGDATTDLVLQGPAWSGPRPLLRPCPKMLTTCLWPSRPGPSTRA